MTPQFVSLNSQPPFLKLLTLQQQQQIKDDMLQQQLNKVFQQYQQQTQAPQPPPSQPQPPPQQQNQQQQQFYQQPYTNFYQPPKNNQFQWTQQPPPQNQQQPQQDLNTQRTTTAIESELLAAGPVFPDFVHPSLYTLNGEIIWRAINQDKQLENYPLITKEILSKKFTNLTHFFQNKPFQLYSLKEIKHYAYKASDSPRLPLNQQIEENNSKAMQDVEYEKFVDNRMDKLHPLVFKHAPLCPFNDLINMVRQSKLPITPITIFDLSHIRWSGKISNETWIKLHDLGCRDLRLKMFFSKDPMLHNINKVLKLSSDQDGQSLNVEQKNSSDDFDSVTQTKVALNVLSEAQQSVFTFNKTGAMINFFITSKGDFHQHVFNKLQNYSDRAQARLIERFTDVILEENGNRFSTGQELHSLETMEQKYNTIINALEVKNLLRNAMIEETDEKERNREREAAAKAKYQPKRFNPNSSLNNSSPKDSISQSICRAFNKGSCSRPLDPSQRKCKLITKSGATVELKHMCNATKQDGTLCQSFHTATSHNSVMKK